MVELPGRRSGGDGALCVRADAPLPRLRGAAGGLLGDRGHHLRRRPLPAGGVAGLVPVRRRPGPVRARRRVHLRVPQRRVPVAGRRHLPVAVPGAVRRHRGAGPAPQPERRMGIADRLADPHHRPRPDLVAGADLAGDPRRQPGHARPAGLGRLPHRRHPAAGLRASAGGRHRQAAARLLPAVRQHRHPASDRLRVRRDAEQRHLQRSGLARHRLDELLPALGGVGAAPLHAHAGGAAAREGDGRCHGRGWWC